MYAHSAEAKPECASTHRKCITPPRFAFEDHQSKLKHLAKTPTLMLSSTSTDAKAITDATGTLVDVQGFQALEALLQEQHQQYGLN